MNKKFIILAATCMLSVPTLASELPTEAKIKFEPKRNDKVSSSNSIISVENFSPKKIGRGWITLDHIGYKDSAFSGERHIAYKDNNIQFFGYDKEGLSDMMFLPHNYSENQTIGMTQSPIRADWHTLDGNGLLFGVEVHNTPQKDEFNLVKEQPMFTFSGYSVVATATHVEVREYNNISPTEIGTSYKVLFSKLKDCPSQDFFVDIKGNKADIYVTSKKISTIGLSTKGRWTGIVATYKEHSCNSLSSTTVYNHTVNGVNYLMPNKEQENNNGKGADIQGIFDDKFGNIKLEDW